MPPKVARSWEWKNDDEQWVEYNAEDAALIEGLFGEGRTIVRTTELSFNRDFGTMYHYNFSTMTQLNTESKTKRTIRRVKAKAKAKAKAKGKAKGAVKAIGTVKAKSKAKSKAKAKVKSKTASSEPPAKKARVVQGKDEAQDDEDEEGDEDEQEDEEMEEREGGEEEDEEVEGEEKDEEEEGVEEDHKMGGPSGTPAAPLSSASATPVVPAGAPPLVTARTFAGNVVWGPKQVSPGMLVGELANLLDRPCASPGLRLVHGTAVLEAGRDLSAIASPCELVVQYDAPKSFDHSFVEKLVQVSDDFEERGHMRPWFAGECVANPGARITVPGAEVMRCEICKAPQDTEDCAGDCRVEVVVLRLRLPTGSPLVSVYLANKKLQLKLNGQGYVVGRCEAGKKCMKLDQPDALAQGTILQQDEGGMVVNVETRMVFSDSTRDLPMTEGPIWTHWALLATRVIHEGVSYCTGHVSSELTARLNGGIGKLRDKGPPDYHPGSKNIVRDLVHPSLYPYIEGTSKMAPGFSLDDLKQTMEDRKAREQRLAKMRKAEGESDEDGKGDGADDDSSKGDSDEEAKGDSDDGDGDGDGADGSDEEGSGDQEDLRLKEERQKAKEEDAKQFAAGGLVLERLGSQDVSDRVLHISYADRTFRAESGDHCDHIIGARSALCNSGILYYEVELRGSDGAVAADGQDGQKILGGLGLGFAVSGWATAQLPPQPGGEGDGDENSEDDVEQPTLGCDGSWCVTFAEMSNFICCNGADERDWPIPVWERSGRGSKERLSFAGMSQWQKGDVICVAANLAEGKFAVARNGAWSDAPFGVVADDVRIRAGVFPVMSISPSGDPYVYCYSFGGAGGAFKYSAPGADVWALSQVDMEATYPACAKLVKDCHTEVRKEERAKHNALLRERKANLKEDDFDPSENSAQDTEDEKPDEEGEDEQHVDCQPGGEVAGGGGPPKRDIWGRIHEKSIYQWLPTEVTVSSQGRCDFGTAINNLERESNAELYTALAELLGVCLPHLEAAWSYGRSIVFPADFSDHIAFSGYAEGQVEQVSLRNRQLQVIVKIVDYEVPALGQHEGVWHVEGMSHENIVATAELILAKDPALTGGGLEFKRAFTEEEAAYMHEEMPQGRPTYVNKAVEDGLVPLGQLTLPVGRIAAWPNSHVHRITPLKNSQNATAKRTIIVFWLVNPDVRVLSTQCVVPLQETMGLEEAHAHRLKLMEERKRHKQDWNVRDISLCEH